MGTLLKPAHIDLPAQPMPDATISDCRGVASILAARFGDKWSVFVIMMLSDGPKRFQRASSA